MPAPPGIAPTPPAGESRPPATRDRADDLLPPLWARWEPLAPLPRQIIHGDLHPGNLLVAPGKPVGIIDLAPYWGSADFALAMFANWVGPRRGRVNLLAYFADVPEFPQLLLLAEHARAPDGAHRRVVNPAHFAPLFGRKPRGQVMLYREALLGLGGVAQRYLSELSRRQRARLGTEVLAAYALYERCGAAELLAAMELAQAQGAFGPAYLGALVSAPVPEPPPEPASLELTDVPAQTEIDRELSAYEAYVWPIDVQHDLDHHELVLNGRHADELQPGLRGTRTAAGAAVLAPGGGRAARLAGPCGQPGVVVCRLPARLARGGERRAGQRRDAETAAAGRLSVCSHDRAVRLPLPSGAQAAGRLALPGPQLRRASSDAGAHRATWLGKTMLAICIATKHTHKAIIDACRELIETGAAVTMPEVARLALVSKATAYR